MIRTAEELQKHLTECQETGFVISDHNSVCENSKHLAMKLLKLRCCLECTKYLLTQDLEDSDELTKL